MSTPASTTSADDADQRGTFSRVSIDTRQHWRDIQESMRQNALGALKSQLAAAGMQGKYDVFLPHVQAFVDRAIQTAKPNLRINGRNINADDDDDQDDDQFDEVLDRKVWSLSAQRLKWDLEIANKRRTMPRDVEALMLQLGAQRDEHERELLAATLEGLESVDEDVEMDGEREGETAGEHETYQRTTELLGVLRESVPEQLERARRFEVAEKEIRSLKP